MEDVIPVVSKDDLLSEIYAAFDGVNRDGGVSWRGAEIADAYGDESMADYIDRDSTWQDLVDDPLWRPSTGWGGWSFLDPIGFRYYLPAGMIRTIRSGYDEGVQFHLTLPKRWLRDFTLQKWSLLNDRQQVCVKRFLEYMAATDADEQFINRWRKALESHWANEGEARAGFDPTKKLLSPWAWHTTSRLIISAILVALQMTFQFRYGWYFVAAYGFLWAVGIYSGITSLNGRRRGNGDKQ